MKIYEIEITNHHNGNHGYKFVEAESELHIRKNKHLHVGENVEIGTIELLPDKTLRSAINRNHRQNGIRVINGVRVHTPEPFKWSN
jgi:hypothetical protein